MRKEDIDNILSKYKEGDTSLQEENSLVSNANSVTTALNFWFKYIHRNKKMSPKNIENRIWEQIQQHRIKKRRHTIGIFSAAASILLFASTITFHFNHKQSLKEKEHVLNEALRMFENTELQTSKTVIYEDDIIIIYTTME